MTDWNDELIARFTALHHGGERSFSTIAATLNREFDLELTKNACIGKARRLGLEQRPKSTPATMNARRTHKTTAQDRAQTTPQLSVVPVLPRWTVEPPVLPASSGRLTIYQLQSGVCHFPFGERPPYAYCGNTTRRGMPWCPHHERVVYPRGVR